MEKQAWIQDPKTANTARFHWPWDATRWATLYWCCVDAMAELSSQDSSSV
jgi:hypothetical protein